MFLFSLYSIIIFGAPKTERCNHLAFGWLRFEIKALQRESVCLSISEDKEMSNYFAVPIILLNVIYTM